MERKLSEKNYIAIADWMVTDLNLNSRELLTYAIIYGFSQDGESFFSGSLSYLAAWLNVSDRNNVRRTLNSLIEKGLIEKQTIKLNDKQTSCLYRVTSSKGETKMYDHIFISPWMINSMNLKDKELILYALIYGFSRLGSTSYCQASTEYIGKWIGVQKNHVKERYLNKMIKDGYILAIESKTENTKFQAVVPDIVAGGSDSQNDHTSPKIEENNEVSQNDHTTSHFNHTSNPKTTTLNIYNLENNLNDNLFSINNNSNSDSNKKPSKDSLSVVVNRNIFPDTFMFDYEKEAFDFKKELDQRLFKKYSCKDIDVAEFMSKYAETLFRMMLASWPDSKDYAERISDLLLDVATDRHFSKKAKQINSLLQQKVKNLYDAADELLDPNSGKYIRKSKKAYMIGVLDNILES